MVDKAMTAPLTLAQAMKAIEQGLAADNRESGDFWQARKLLDAAGIYNENLSGTRVLLELARVALLAVPQEPHSQNEQAWADLQASGGLPEAQEAAAKWQKPLGQQRSAVMRLGPCRRSRRHRNY